MLRLRAPATRVFLIGTIVSCLASVACTVPADPKSPFLGEWRLLSNNPRNQAQLILLKTGSCNIKIGEQTFHSCSWVTDPSQEVTVNYGRYLSLSSASATVAGDELTFRFANNPDAQWVFTRAGSQHERDTITYLQGEAFNESGDFGHAIEQWTRAADRGHSGAQNSLAWIYATCKRPEFLDAKKAVAYAEKATASLRHFAYLDTLAAALARDGQFARAVQIQEEAIALLEKDDVWAEREATLGRFKTRLALYQAGQAYTEP